MPTTAEDRFRETLDEAECRHLLTTTTIGRLGFTEDALPAILPVLFTLQDGHILITDSPDSPVANAVRRSVVAFEVDEYDPAARAGWSVTVVGPAQILSDPDQAAVLGRPGVSQGPPNPSRCFIAVRLGLVRGWRMTPYPVGAAPPDVDTPTTGEAEETPAL